MNRAKLFRLSARLANSLSSTQQPRSHSFRLTQVTHFSCLPLSSPFPLLRKPQSSYNFPLFHQNLYFSSKPQTFLDIILSNDWSEEIEKELQKLNPKMTHEFVVYVMMKLNENPEKSLGFFRWVCDRNGFRPSFLPYKLLLSSLTCREFVKEFWVVAAEMKEKGICIDKQTYNVINASLRREKLDETAVKFTEFHKTMSESNAENDVVKDVVKVVLESDWNEGVESKLKKLKVPLSEDLLSRIIWGLRNEPLRALKFFEWVRSDQKYEHNSVTYSEMARILARGGLIDEFWELTTRMRSEGYEIDLFVKVSRCLGNGDAVKLFEFMMDSPYKISEQECVWLLKELIQDSEPDMDLVTRVVNKYVEVGNTKTKAIYDCMHRSLCKVGEFDEAKKIVEDMKNAGYKPDNITFSQEVFGLCKVRRFEDACSVLNLMEEEGCVPDIKTWTILIQGYCAAGQVDQALLWFARMIEKGLEPDADMLRVLIDGFLFLKKVSGAYQFLVDMVNKTRLKPWQATYKLMIEKLLESGKVEEAFNLLSMMKQQDYPPYGEPFVKYISKSGTVEDAKRILKALPRNGVPSTAAAVKVISSFFEEGRHFEAKDLLYGCPPRVRKHNKIQKMFGLEQLS